MTRRIFFAVFAAIALGRTFAHADEPSNKIPRVGVLTPAENPATPSLEAFSRGLRELGYVDGRNIIIDYRCARGDFATLRRQAEELTKVPVDIIVTDGTASAQVAADATHTVPIVMGIVSDPLALRLAQSMARPGGTSRDLLGCRPSSVRSGLT
jgi:putative ABC transport system substrate-binding protein